jgi:hypothetical protein
VPLKKLFRVWNAALLSVAVLKAVVLVWILKIHLTWMPLMPAPTGHTTSIELAAAMATTGATTVEGANTDITEKIVARLRLFQGETL